MKTIHTCFCLLLLVNFWGCASVGPPGEEKSSLLLDLQSYRPSNGPSRNKSTSSPLGGERDSSDPRPLSFSTSELLDSSPPGLLISAYPIDLDTVLRLAAGNNLDIALLRQHVHSVYAQELQAYEQFIPVVEPLFQFWRLEGTTQGTLGEFDQVTKQNTLVGTGVALRWPLGEVIYKALSAQQRYASSQSALHVTTRHTLLQAALAYFDLVGAEQRLHVLERAVAIAFQVVSETRSAVAAGRGFQADVLRTQAQWTHNRLLLARARESLQSKSFHLTALLRIHPTIILYPADTHLAPLNFVSLKNKPLQTLITQALTQRPELVQIHHEQEAARWDKTAAKWGPLIPELQADVQFGGFGPVPNALEHQNIYRLALLWKIGPGGLFDVGRQREVEAHLRSIEIQKAQTEQKIIEEVTSLYTVVQSRSRQKKLSDENVQDARESLKLNEERQKMGGALPLEVIQAEEALTQARLDDIDALTTYNQAQFHLFYALGQPLGQNYSGPRRKRK